MEEKIITENHVNKKLKKIETIGERIARLRKSVSLTQAGLAEKLNVTDKAVSKWESNKSDPSIDLLPMLSKELKCSIDYIVKGSDNKDYEVDVDEIKAKIEELINMQNIKISYIQILFEIGYSRACEIAEELMGYDLMEEMPNGKGYVINMKTVNIFRDVLFENIYTIKSNVLLKKNNPKEYKKKVDKFKRLIKNAGLEGVVKIDEMLDTFEA